MKRTSDRKIRLNKKGTETSAVQIIEESFHLLRSAPGSCLWLYFFGTVPFACLLIYFWADMSRSSYANQDAGLVSLGLALAFFWKCSCQARFCRSLWESISPGDTPLRTAWQTFRHHSALWMFQALSIPITILAICFVLPLGWVLTTFQNGTALALTQDYGNKPLRRMASSALKNSHYDWAQNLGIWITMGFITLLSWANIYAACSLPPLIGKTFFGIESVFSMNAGALSNTTFIFGTLLVTWLILSPLVKTIFVLRCFYVNSRTTGADLLSRLADRRKQSQGGRESKKRLSPAARQAALLVFALGLLASGMTQAQEKTTPNVTEYHSADLDLAIQDTMKAKKYQWKFSRQMVEIPDEEESWLQTQLNHLVNAIETRIRLLKAWMSDKIEEFMDRLSAKNSRKSRPKIPSLSASAGEVLMQIGWGILIAVVAGLLAWLIFVLVKYFKVPETLESDDSSAISDIDLESEDIVADQLQEDQWMNLARQQIEKGEARLAIRALFLATLAHLGERGLLKIQKYKSNRDYQQELDLKARQKARLRDAFQENTGLFERVWYGWHHIGDEALSHFMKNYETITTEPAT